MRFQGLSILSILILLFLCSCSTTRYINPKAFESTDYVDDCPKVTETETDNTRVEICKSLRFTEDRLKYYHERSTGVRRESTWIFDVPLIALASGTGAALLFDGKDDLIKGLGLGLVTWAGFSNYFYDMNIGDYFRTAEGSVDCIHEKATPFTYNIALVEKPLDLLIEDIKTAEELLTSADAPPETSKEYKALEEALVVARTAYINGEIAKTNYRNAPGQIWRLVYAVDRKVSKFIATNAVDVSEIIEQINKSTQDQIEAAKKQEEEEQATKELGISISNLDKSVPQETKSVQTLISKLGENSTLVNSAAKPINDAKPAMDFCTSNL